MKTSKLLIAENPLQVLPGLAVAIGLNEAIVLQQIHYWIMGMGNKGNGWIYNTIKEWQDQFPFWSKRTILRTFKNLKKSGLVLSKKHKTTSWDRKNTYTIDYDELDRKTSKIVEISHGDNLALCNVPKSHHRRCQKGTIEDAKMEPSLKTEITHRIPETIQEPTPKTATAPTEVGTKDIEISYSQKPITIKRKTGNVEISEAGQQLWQSVYELDKALGTLPPENDAKAKVLYYHQAKVAAEDAVRRDGYDKAFALIKWVYQNKFCGPFSWFKYVQYKKQYIASVGEAPEDVNARVAKEVYEKLQKKNNGDKYAPI